MSRNRDTSDLMNNGKPLLLLVATSIIAIVLVTLVVVQSVRVGASQLQDALAAMAPLQDVGVVSDVAELSGSTPEEISFNEHVRPILSENCYFCHGPDANQRQAGLRLDTEDGAAAAIEAGFPDDSELIARIFSDDPDLQMPPPDSGREIEDAQKLILKRWIEQGANYETHWSFKPPGKVEVPVVDLGTWPRNEIDRFVLAKLEGRQIEPAPRAEPQVIVRRLCLDLIGLPPTVEQVNQFVDQYQANAEQTIDGFVDELLESQHYGERMALPWLDAARYSDSNGFQQDGDRHQWPWRDWVVDALNNNMPFDQFTIEQLAGDLLPSPTNEKLIATAFNRNHMLNGEGGAIAEEQRNNYVFDRVDTTATTWLGLTMACAQCHDHKYDPISQVDYYSFFAYFNSVDENGGVNRRAGRLQCADPYLELPTQDQQEELGEVQAAIKPIYKQLADLDEEIVKSLRQWEEKTRGTSPNIGRDQFRILQRKPEERSKAEDNQLKDYYLLNLAPERFREIRQELKRLEDRRMKVQSDITTIMVMRDREEARQTHLFDRGNYESPKDKVDPAIPVFLGTLSDEEKPNRLSLARWLVDPANPLTSRVAVNRYWQTFFGTGLVKTSEDFGVQGELPSHPKLLDWLAIDFVEHGWDVKRIHRMIVTSETYLQSSRFREDLLDIDPENRLLARSQRFRLPSTLIRDAALAVSGLLNRDIGGKPVYPYQPDGMWKEFSLEKFGYTPSTGKDLYRRSLYTFWRRTVPPPNMFDSANRQACTVKLSRTNTPLQALVMLNDPTFVETFCKLAESVLADESLQDDEARLKLIFYRAVAREPNGKELVALVKALEQSREHYQSHSEEAAQFISVGASVEVPQEVEGQQELAAFASVAQVVINTDEFMTRE